MKYCIHFINFWLIVQFKGVDIITKRKGDVDISMAVHYDGEYYFAEKRSVWVSEQGDHMLYE